MAQFDIEEILADKAEREKALSSLRSFGRSTLVLVVIASVFLVASLAAVIYFQGKGEGNTTGTGESPEQTGRANGASIPKIIFNLSGPVLEMGENFLSIEATITKLDDEGEVIRTKEKRTALFKPSTKVTRLEFVVQDGTNQKVPKETTVSIGAISIGDFVEVISNRDISEKIKFEATHIRLLP